MILLALGANLPGPYGTPREACVAALALLDARGVHLVRRSRWFRSAPVPPSDQPWYVNGVAVVETTLEPEPLLATLHAVEAMMGRVRAEPNAARCIDLDLLAHGAVVRDSGQGAPILPHPRLHERAFVLLPLLDVAPDWVHPLTGVSARTLAAALGADASDCQPLEEEASPGGTSAGP